MKKVSKLLGVLLASAMLASAVPFGAAAEGGDISLVPILDQTLWEGQAGDNEYKELNADGAWISADIDASGAVTLKRTANCKEGYNWPRIRTPMSAGYTINLADNPTFYFDLTATSSWNMSIAVGDKAIGLAKGIYEASGKDPNTLVGDTDKLIERDGGAGDFKGSLDLAKYVQENFPDFSGELTVQTFNIYMVDATADHLSGSLTVRQFAIGKSEPTSPDTPVTTVAGGDNKTTAAGGNTTTTAKAAADNPKTGENDIAVLCCLAAGAVALTAVTLTVSRKKRNHQ